MPLLFSYGTLRDGAVQQSIFGRRLESSPDELTEAVKSAALVPYAPVHGWLQLAGRMVVEPEPTGVSPPVTALAPIGVESS